MTLEDELDRLRALLEAEWPGFAATREPLALAGAPAAIAAFWARVGWSPALDRWLDPRAVEHEAQLAEWIAEGRLEHSLVADEDEEGEEVDDPALVATAWTLGRDDLPRRARVLRRFDQGGDLTLWVADETQGEGDPPVLRCSLRGEILVSVASAASRFLVEQTLHDLAERRAVLCVVRASDPRALGAPLLPVCAPSIVEVAPRVLLEIDVAPGAPSPHRVSAPELGSLVRWLQTLPPGRIDAIGAPPGDAVRVAAPVDDVAALLEDGAVIGRHHVGTLEGVAVWASAAGAATRLIVEPRGLELVTQRLAAAGLAWS